MEEQEMNRSEAVQEEAKPQTSAKKQGLFHDIMDIIETMMVSVFVVLLLFTYIMRPVTVDGRSMNPTLVNQDKLVMFRLCYAPTRGDIVVVDNQEGHVLDENGRVKASGYSLHENIIKRIIAVAGQTVEVDEKAGKVYVDGVELDEPYINEPTLSNDGAFIYPITVPEGYVFVMGDNRNHSTDSRDSRVGFISEDDIIGKVALRILPLDKFGAVN